MNLHINTITQAMSGLAVKIQPAEFEAQGFHACLLPESGSLMPAVARLLYDQAYFLVFVTACHTDPVAQALYQFARFDENLRLMVRCPVDHDNTIPTISHIFQGANWHERETRDFFGITFKDHPNPAPLLLDESDKDLAPLLKDKKKLKPVEEIFPAQEDAQ
jgi:NADH-quinone oxidoreductase subunit C